MAPTIEGYWGKPTSTLDWCEKNYEVTYYITEFWNTITNLIMIIPPLYGVYICILDRMDLKFINCFLSLLIVGIGSWCFHCTLLFEMQLLDELPMVLGSCVLVYIQLDLYCKSSVSRPLIGLLLFLYGSVVCIVYLFNKNPVFHEVCFGVLAVYSMVLGYLTTIMYGVPKRWYGISVTMYLFSFLLWNIDNIFCSKVTEIRENMPYGLGPLTQLHGWWHLGTGYSGYIIILCCIRAHMQKMGMKYKIVSSWVAGFTLRALPSRTE